MNSIKDIIRKLIKEAYVDRRGQLQDFDAFPYNIDLSDDMSPLYNQKLPIKNRVKAPDGGVYLRLIVSDPYQREVLDKALKIAVDKGKNMPDFGGRQYMKGFKYGTYGDTLKLEISSKQQKLLISIIEDIRKQDEIKFKQMQDNEKDMDEYEKMEQLKMFHKVFNNLIKSFI